MTQIDPARSIRDFYAFHLKRHREAAGLSQPALAALVHVSPQLIGHLENAVRRPTLRLSRALDAALGLNCFFEGLFPRLIEESGLPSGFVEYVDEEARAAQIKIYCQWLISGLFQCEEYAREVLSGLKGNPVDELVRERLARQEVLHREPRPSAVVLMDEGVLRKVVGGTEVMKAQFQHLLKLVQEPDIDIYVIPFGAKAYPEGSFTVLSFDHEPDLGYVENAGGQGHLLEAGPRVTKLAVLFDRLRAMALSAPDSDQLLRMSLESM